MIRQGRAQNTKTLLLRQSHGQNEAWMYNVWVGKTKDSKSGGNFGRIRMGGHDGSATDVGAISVVLHDSLDLIVSSSAEPPPCDHSRICQATDCGGACERMRQGQLCESDLLHLPLDSCMLEALERRS